MKEVKENHSQYETSITTKDKVKDYLSQKIAEFLKSIEQNKEDTLDNFAK